MSDQLFEAILDSCNPETSRKIDSKHWQLGTDQTVMVRCGDLVGSVVCLDFDGCNATITALCRWKNLDLRNMAHHPWRQLDELELIAS